jgi:hypothetical protein
MALNNSFDRSALRPFRTTPTTRVELLPTPSKRGAGARTMLNSAELSDTPPAGRAQCSRTNAAQATRQLSFRPAPFGRLAEPPKKRIVALRGCATHTSAAKARRRLSFRSTSFNRLHSYCWQGYVRMGEITVCVFEYLGLANQRAGFYKTSRTRDLQYSTCSTLRTGVGHEEAERLIAKGRTLAL